MADSLKPVLLFDGVCNLCNSTVQWIIKNDPKAIFLFAALQSDAGQKLLNRFHLPVNDFDSFVLVEGGKVYLRSEAGLRVLKGLGGGWSLFYILIFFPAPIRDMVYRFVARNRYRVFGKKESCMVPTPEIQSRFL